MKIKDAEILTGLSAKTIRYYESQGLISVKRNSNSYREYDEESINELRRIKILRNLEIPISKIKELNLGQISLKDILEVKLKELDENELNLERKKGSIEAILEELNKNPNVDLAQYSEEFEFLESPEFNEFMGDMKELSEWSLSYQIIITLIFSAPLLRLFMNIDMMKYEFIKVDSIISIISTVVLTLIWRRFLKQKNKKIKGTGCMLLSLILAIVLALAIFVGISKLQEVIFVPNDYLMLMFKEPYCYLVFFFEVEIIVVLVASLYKKIKNIEWEWASLLFDFVKKNLVATVILNLVLLYVCITGITVVTKNQIKDYNFYNPTGTTYSYNDISKVKTGFKGKGSTGLKGNAGEFYYIVKFEDGKKINFDQPDSSPFEDTYLELEIFDKLIMSTGKAEKESAKDNYEFCDLDKRYVDRFLRIIGNR